MTKSEPSPEVNVELDYSAGSLRESGNRIYKGHGRGKANGDGRV